MAQIWGLINGLQLFVSLPLFMVAFPEVSVVMVNALISVATFDIFPSAEIFEGVLDAPVEVE